MATPKGLPVWTLHQSTSRFMLVTTSMCFVLPTEVPIFTDDILPVIELYYIHSAIGVLNSFLWGMCGTSGSGQEEHVV